jgi:hypothetical protein
MENILIKNFENQYRKIKKDKKNISKLIKKIKGGERIVIQDPKILTKKLEDIKALLESYNNEKKVINYEPIKEALKEINQLSKRIEAIKQNITKVKQKDNASEISQELIDESLNLFKNINFEELEDDTLKLSIAKKPVIIDVPIDLKKEQLDQISEKFVGEYYDIKTQLKGNPDDFENIIENLEEKISEIKEQYEQYKNDTEYTKQQIEFYSQTLYPNFEANQFTSIKSNDLGPDIVSLKNYMIQLNPVKSDEIDSKYQEISNFVSELQTDVQLNLPERNELQIIADPTFDKSEGSVFYQDPEEAEKRRQIKEQQAEERRQIEEQQAEERRQIEEQQAEERRQIEEQQEKESKKIIIKNKISGLQEQINELTERRDKLKNYLDNPDYLNSLVKKENRALFDLINHKKELSFKNKYLLTSDKIIKIKELFDFIKNIDNSVRVSEIKEFIKKITGIEINFSGGIGKTFSAPDMRDHIRNNEDIIGQQINGLVNLFNNINNLRPKYDESLTELKENQDLLQEANEELQQLEQLGGSTQVERLNIIDKNDTLMQKTLEYSQSISTLNSILSDYYKVIEAYNILYLQVSFYQIFLFLSTTRQIATEETMMYKYISLGTCNYYKRIIDSILVKIEKKDNSQVIMYFKKYHLILLKKLQDFLNQIGNLKQMKNNLTGELVEIDKKDNIDIEKCQDNVKNMFHLLNLFKDVLDDYKHMFSDKVSIFARINDFENEMQYTKNFKDDPYWNTTPDYTRGNKNRPIEDRIKEEFIFTRDKDDSSKLNVSGFNCEKLLDDNNKVKDLDIKYKNIVENGVKFSEVFNTQEFPDNDTLSLYMGLSSQISQKKGTMLITYGYSGVGKTATLFGSSQGGFPGLLQRTLMNIKSGNDSQILFRVFELYGKGFKYFFYWNPENGAQHKHHQSVYQYVLKLQGGKVNVDKVLEKKDRDIGDFINQSEDLNQNIDSYINITHDQYKNFDTIVDAIDKKRLEAGRIRSTSNNPVSSRSIVFYEFQILIDNEYVPFIVMDLPGKENIINTFVDGIQDININTKPSIDRFTKAAMFLDPLYLPTINGTFAEIILTTVYEEYRNVFNKFMKKKYFTVGTSENNYGVRFENNFNQDILNLTKITPKYNKDKIKDDFKAQYGALELMKYLIENNHFEIIERINLKLFGNKISSEKIERIKSATKGAFEGIYINENILGIIVYIIKNILKKDNSDNYISRQSDPYLELKDQYNNKFSTKNPFKTSLEAATFNFRDLIRGRNNMYVDNYENVFSRFDVPYNEDRFFDNILTDIQNSYDPKKTYNSDNPLIGDILKPYLEKIENYYMFYLLSNNDPDTKCEKQMKLLDGSYNFIKALNQSE